MAKQQLQLPSFVQAEPWAEGRVVVGTLTSIEEIPECASRKLVFDSGKIAVWETTALKLYNLAVGVKYEIKCLGKKKLGKREGWAFEAYKLD